MNEVDEKPRCCRTFLLSCARAPLDYPQQVSPVRISVILLLAVLACSEIAGATENPHQLLARGIELFNAGEFEKAVEVLLEAQAGMPSTSESALWLARAFGRLAERSSWMHALAYARETHKFLELAVELDPRNRDALLDLQEYYLKAPQFLGGSTSKAEDIERRLRALDAVGSK